VRGTADPQVADQLLRYISNARWFAGKGRQVQFRSLTPLPWLTEVSDFFSPAAPPGVRFEIAEVAYPAEEDPESGSVAPGGAEHDAESADESQISEPPEMILESSPSSTEYYHLAISYRSAPHTELHHAEIGRFTDSDLGPVIAYDAAQDPEACRVILTTLLADRKLRSPDSEARFHASNTSGLRSDLRSRPFTGQQSNTSVMLGETAILKLFRRLELGRNLDIEMHAALNTAGSSEVASLFGWIEGSWVSNGRQLDADLGMVIEQLADAVDGWELALESLRAGNTSTKIETAKINTGKINIGSDFAAEAEALGRGLADIHSALRSSFPTTKVPGARTAMIMMDRLYEAARIAPALAPHLPGLRRCFDELRSEMLVTQRVHGDFHLGQTLHTPSGWKITDFEGEPAKSIGERRLPDSVWRDVAGMLRSFDYAAASVPAAHSPAWAAQCRAAFLRGYLDGELDQTSASMLRAYEADKAIYEVVYEMRNRPQWIEIPLRAVAELAAQNQDSNQVAPGEPASPPKERGEPASRTEEQE
jgi:maltokinase